MPDTIQLRGHHLLCILTYIGKGYTKKFIQNLTSIVDQINRGAIIEIVAGSDSICRALRRGIKITCDHARICHKNSVKNRDSLALRDVSRVLGLPLLRAGDHLLLKPRQTRLLRRYFAHGAIRKACATCPWHRLCSAVVTEHFRGVKLHPN